MRELRLLALALVCAIGCAVPPGAAAANSAPIPVFSFASSNGFRVVGTVFESKSGATRLALRSASRTQSVFYTSFPAAYDEASGSIAADLGAFGEIDLRFHHTGGERAVRSPCDEDDAFRVPAGYFEGTVEFIGERSYTRASVARARLDGSYIAAILCPGFAEGIGPGFGGAHLVARRRIDRYRAATFEAVTNGPSRKALVYASLTELVGGIRIMRTAEVRAPASVFSFGPKYRAATVSPQSPFHGSAEFARTEPPRAGAGSWRGSLTVDMAGRPGVPLAGPAFEATLRPAEFEVLRP